ncbi:MarR family transcriptional regulator [Halorubrum ezzemoulense]|uniref:MarR family transcriptional regulator n=1 Tax=Halorubrum ezzemoulense TaxID=337243 RepID=A0ABT4Z473_HALEZ|nr:MarR family transcriptional regulator [Halorubrum ezzemoulense]MDB2245715.1 MarR family transcriptional regulator [Halorubrum ezzemoulense]MDB2279362.1 MarR family transcriptional regulator [Halorubrum ezzemoulense]MDB2289868.1 MarR family transcriptional regulator [Halorubrum ezzemoulense]MDB2292952.1 MarR family transcriptional regulator [Halorubrum ezzemoulense]MDB2297338.1 MarR family transcriptional regulator [Halorubrum ezzemoulense]
MRYAGSWMTAVDDRILEYLSEHESGSPTKMKREGPIRYSRQQVHRRCKKLAENSLINDLGNGVYMITENGEAYLEGRLDTENWQYIDEETEENVHNDSTEDTVTDG